MFPPLEACLCSRRYRPADLANVSFCSNAKRLTLVSQQLSIHCCVSCYQHKRVAVLCVAPSRVSRSSLINAAHCIAWHQPYMQAQQQQQARTQRQQPLHWLSPPLPLPQQCGHSPRTSPIMPSACLLVAARRSNNGRQQREGAEQQNEALGTCAAADAQGLHSRQGTMTAQLQLTQKQRASPSGSVSQ